MEEPIKHWSNIATMTPFSLETVKRRFGPEMLARGVVFKSQVGRGRKCMIWGYPSKIMEFFQEKQRQEKKV